VSGRISQLARAICLAWIGLAGGALAGTVTEFEVDSAAIGRPVPVAVYRPDGDGPFPVLYLLHGYGGGHRDWVNAGAVETTADTVFVEAGVAPMLIVMPGVGNSWYVDGGATGRHGAWATAITTELIPEVEARYPTLSSRADRFVAGLSMGGYGALHLATQRPDLFRAAAAFSPAIFPDAGHANDFPGFQMKFFDGAFGTPFDVDFFNDRNIFQPLPEIGAALDSRPLAFYVMTGDHDGFGLWRGALAFFTAARDAGIPAELRVHDGNHEWRLWRAELDDALRWFATLRDASD